MKINYCLPIQRGTRDAVEEMLRIEHEKNEYAWFEVWLDLVGDLDEEWVREIVSRYRGKLLLLFRRPNLERIRMDMGKRKRVMDIVLQSDALVDLDISQEEELEYIKSQVRKHLVLSYHNYKETPGREDLEKIVRRMGVYEPAVYKIATLCNNREDGLGLLGLLLDLKRAGKRCIVLGMGEFGVITRVFGTLWGNEMVFAPRSLEEESAVGQVTREKLKIILDVLK